MVILATLSGAKLPADSALMPILFKRLNIKGSTLRSRSPEYQGELLGRFEKEALGSLGAEGGDKEMKVSIHKVSRVHTVVLQVEADPGSSLGLFMGGCHRSAQGDGSQQEQRQGEPYGLLTFEINLANANGLPVTQDRFRDQVMLLYPGSPPMVRNTAGSISEIIPTRSQDKR